MQLAKKFKLDLIETSKIFEDKKRSSPNNQQVVQALQDMQSGKLFDPAFAFQIIKERIEKLKQLKQTNGFVLNGSPRTLYEAKKLIDFLAQTYDINKINFFYLKVPKKETIERLSKRKVCSICKRPVNINTIGDINSCKYCGGKIVTREDDKPEILKIRFKEYNERTKPIIGFLNNIGLNILNIDGTGSIEDVLKRLTSKIN